MTKGARWGVFGLLALTAFLLFAFPPFLIGAAVALSQTLWLGAGTFWAPIFAVFASAAMLTIEATVLLFILPTAMFHKLRLAKDGVSGESLTGVFE